MLMGPAGSFQAWETKTHYYCQPIGEKLPVVNPAMFTMPGEQELLKTNIRELELQRDLYQQQLERILDLKRKNQLAADEINIVQQQILLTNASHALKIIRAGVTTLATGGYLTPVQAQQINRLITTTNAAVNGAISATADPGSERQLNHAMDAVFELKNLINVSGKTITPEQLDALKKGLDVIPPLVRISERVVNGKAGENPGETYRKHLDDLLAAGAVFFPPGQMLRSAGHIVAGEIALWQVRQDRDMVNADFTRVRTAQKYYDLRISQVDELLDFYRQQLIKTNVH